MHVQGQVDLELKIWILPNIQRRAKSLKLLHKTETEEIFLLWGLSNSDTQTTQRFNRGNYKLISHMNIDAKKIQIEHKNTSQRSATMIK